MGNRDNDDRPQDPGQRNAPRPSNRRRQGPPDDRLTTILPAVRDDRAPRRSDPIDEVKAALAGPPSAPLRRDAIDEVKAALDSRGPASGRQQRAGSGGRPPGGP
ncbi:penicillin-binding protein, partial [Mycobacterium intracellulare]